MQAKTLQATGSVPLASLAEECCPVRLGFRVVFCLGLWSVDLSNPAFQGLLNTAMEWSPGHSRAILVDRRHGYDGLMLCSKDSYYLSLLAYLLLTVHTCSMFAC